MIETLYGPIPAPIFEKAAAISLLICDVDGVFSDGRIYMGNQGEEFKAFHTRDGYGVKCLMAAGVEMAVITGRQSNIVTQRMTALGISHVYQGHSDKTLPYQILLQQLKLPPNQIAYIGDDLIDWPVMADVGLSVCVQDGHPLLKQRAHLVTQTSGGYGAVREICDLILQAKNQLESHQGLSI